MGLIAYAGADAGTEAELEGLDASRHGGDFCGWRSLYDEATRACDVRWTKITPCMG